MANHTMTTGRVWRPFITALVKYYTLKATGEGVLLNERGVPSAIPFDAVAATCAKQRGVVVKLAHLHTHAHTTNTPRWLSQFRAERSFFEREVRVCVRSRCASARVVARSLIYSAHSRP